MQIVLKSELRAIEKTKIIATQHNNIKLKSELRAIEKQNGKMDADNRNC